MNILQQLHVKNNVPHSLLKHKNLKSTILFRYAHEVLDIINGRGGSFSCLPTANCPLSSLSSLSPQHSNLSTSLSPPPTANSLLFLSCQLPTADCQLSSLPSALGTQHSALSFLLYISHKVSSSWQVKPSTSIKGDCRILSLNPLRNSASLSLSAASVAVIRT